MAIILSYEELDQVKNLKLQGWKPTKSNLLFIDWMANDLKQARMGLGLTRAEVAEFFDVSDIAVRNWEEGRTQNPMMLGMYGLFLERYYAAVKGYVAGYRKIGENKFIFAEDLKKGTTS